MCRRPSSSLVGRGNGVVLHTDVEDTLILVVCTGSCKSDFRRNREGCVTISVFNLDFIVTLVVFLMAIALL
jgi:hypothetical protein